MPAKRLWRRASIIVQATALVVALAGCGGGKAPKAIAPQSTVTAASTQPAVTHDRPTRKP